MRYLRRNGLLGPAVWLLTVLFLAGQSFACCYATARLGRGLVSLFAPAPSAHACCAKPEAAPEKPSCGGACCIKDASARAPQLASVPAETPVLGIPASAYLPPVASMLPWPPRASPAPDTGPPVYLKTLRLLV